jgi:hypothetical protein
LTIKTLSAWSVSRLLEFEQCPHRSYLSHIVKSPQLELDDSHPMVRGSRIHKEVEEFINGTTEEFPSSGKKLKAYIEECREQYAAGNAGVEDQWGFDSDWNTTGWFDANIWLRMALDYFVKEGNSGGITDWKTGKSFGNEVRIMQQMQLYAIGAFMRDPELEFIDVSVGFLDDGKLRTKNFARGTKITALVSKFTERGNRMTGCVDFRPKPNVGNCRYCPFGPTNGTGACLFGVEA